MKLIKLTSVICVAASYVILLNIIVGMYFADINYVKSEKLLKNGDTKEALRSIDTALRQNPLEPNYLRQKAKVRIVQTIEAENKGKEKELKEAAFIDLYNSYALNPINLATLRNNVALYYFLGSNNIEDINSENNSDEFKSRVLNYFAFVKDYVPNDVGVLVLVAKYEKRLDTKAYEETREKIKYLRPDLLEWHPDLR